MSCSHQLELPSRWMSWLWVAAVCWVVGTVVADQQCRHRKPHHHPFASDDSLACHSGDNDSCHSGDNDWTAVSAPVRRWFSSAWLTPASLHQLQLQIANGTSPVVIHDALTPEAVTQLRDGLNAIPLSRWPLHNSNHHRPPATELFDTTNPDICANLRNPGGGFQFHHHNIFDTEMLPKAPKDLMTFLQGKHAMRLFHQLLHGPVISKFSRGFSAGVFGASWYLPGDYSTVHDDVTVVRDRTGRGHGRRLSLVFHLSDDRWNDVECGGELVWCNSNATGVQILPPVLNQLVLFAPADGKTEHFVNRVGDSSACIRDDVRRLAVNGWYLSPEGA